MAAFTFPLWHLSQLYLNDHLYNNFLSAFYTYRRARISLSCLPLYPQATSTVPGKQTVPMGSIIFKKKKNAYMAEEEWMGGRGSLEVHALDHNCKAMFYSQGK